jgi:archaellum biogenesis ATPase FlaH
MAIDRTDVADRLARPMPNEPATELPLEVEPPRLQTGPCRVTAFSDVAPVAVSWLWHRFIPFGMLTVLDGDPGLGKSTLLIDLAARLSRGEPMPDDIPTERAASSILLSAEDDLASVIRPRLDAARADLNRVFAVDRRSSDGEIRDLAVAAGDLQELELVIRQRDAKLVVIDPLVAYLPANINANRDQDVRRAMSLLRTMAERTAAAVIVVRHLRKAASENALYRGGGSIGIIGAARAGLLVARDPDDPDGARRILAVNKMNQASVATSYAFKLVAADGAADPHVEWDGPSRYSASELLALPDTAEDRSALADADALLREFLAAGKQPARVVAAWAQATGIAMKTLYRAKLRAGVAVSKVGRPGERGQHWVWSLPLAVEDGQDGPKMAEQEVDHLRPSSATFSDPRIAEFEAPSEFGSPDGEPGWRTAEPELP